MRVRTHVQHSARRRMVNVCRQVGITTQEAMVIPELHEVSSDGTVTEARVDVVQTNPGDL